MEAWEEIGADRTDSRIGTLLRSEIIEW